MRLFNRNKLAASGSIQAEPGGEIIKALSKDQRRKTAADLFIDENRGRWVELFTHGGCELQVMCGDAIGDEIIRTGTFEPSLSLLLGQLVPGSKTFLDLGAHVGYFSCLAAKLQASLKIVALEPNPAIFHRTRENLAKNCATFELIEAAVAEAAGVAYLEFPENRPSLGTLGTLGRKKKFGEIQRTEVPVRDLTGLVMNMGEHGVDTLKMDLEGMDVRVLCSLTDEAVSRCRNIICEYSEKRLSQCGSRRLDLGNARWLSYFDLYAVGCFESALKLGNLADFPPGCETLWLRRRSS